jgi:hypothetical protein
MKSNKKAHGSGNKNVYARHKAKINKNGERLNFVLI